MAMMIMETHFYHFHSRLGARFIVLSFACNTYRIAMDATPTRWRVSHKAKHIKGSKRIFVRAEFWECGIIGL